MTTTYDYGHRTISAREASPRMLVSRGGREHAFRITSVTFEPHPEFGKAEGHVLLATDDEQPPVRLRPQDYLAVYEEATADRRA